MEGFVVVFIIVGIFIYITIIMPKKERCDERKQNLANYVSSKHGVDVDTASSKEIDKLLSNPAIRKEAEDLRSMALKNKAKYEDQEHKKLVLQRAYSYKYEDVIYKIFAPYAYNSNDPFSKRQRWMVSTSLEYSFVAHEVACILKMAETHAVDLLKEFAQNGLIDTHEVPHSYYLYCSMGSLLLYNWDVISTNDHNFSDWIETHLLEIEPREKVEERRKEYIRNNL